MQVMEVELGKKMLNKDCGNNLNFSKVLVIALHLACLSTHDLPEEGSEEYIALHKAIYELVRIKSVSATNHTLSI